MTLDTLNQKIETHVENSEYRIHCFQSNHEGAIVDKIQEAVTLKKGMIINPAAYTHTSIAIRDALLSLDIPIIEIHISNIYKREPFRRTSMIADVATAQIAGFGVKGYGMALKALAEMIQSD